MRWGATVSGVAHAGLIVFAVWGVDWLTPEEPEPLTVTEIEFVDGTEFEAALSTAPVVPSEGPAELSPPAKDEPAPSEPETPEDTDAASDAPVLAETPPPEPKPEAPEITFRNPVNVPTEAPAPSIAEIPSPDPLNRKSETPESPPDTEPVQPLASNAPVPQSRPIRPPDPEPEPEPEPEVKPEAAAPSEVAEAAPKPEPEPEPETDPESVAEVQPEAPEGPAPQEARLPVAKPAALAAAAEAAAAKERQIAEEKRREEARVAAANKPKEKKPTKPARTPKPTGGSTARNAPKLNRGEVNALRLGIKKHYVYTGDRSDRNLQVTVRADLDENGRLKGKPKILRGKGGNASSQRALGNAGVRALIKAERAGEFRRLPKNKYPRWKRLNFVFTIDRVAGVSG